MNQRPCITHSIEKGRPCVIRQPSTFRDADYHLEHCLDDGCTGCMPRPALDGVLLCESCFQKFTAAVGLTKDLVTHLRSVERGPQSIDGVRSGALAQPSYPPSWQEADVLWQSLAAIVHAVKPDVDDPYYTGRWVGFSFSATLDMVSAAVQGAVDELYDPETFLNRRATAGAAVEFYRAVQLANRRFSFPLDDPKTVPVKYIRCRSCKAQSLRWVPAIHQYDDVGFECSNANCKAWYDPIAITFDMRLLAQQLAEAGHATEAVEAELVKLLRVPPRDEAWPICVACSARETPTALARTRKPVDEKCGLCGTETDSGLYRRYVA